MRRGSRSSFLDAERRLRGGIGVPQRDVDAREESPPDLLMGSAASPRSRFMTLGRGLEGHDDADFTNGIACDIVAFEQCLAGWR